MLGDRAVHHPEEGLGVRLDIVLPDVGPLARRVAAVLAAMEARGALALDVAVQGLVDGAGHLAERDLLEAVAVALEQACLLPVDPEDLVAVGGLDDAHP